jgi:hypothetical protein
MGKIIFAAVLCLGWCIQAEAGGSTTGNQLKEYCSAPKGSPAWSVCYGYISGAVDAFGALAGLHLVDPMICTPPTVTVGQVFAVAQKYLDEHPDQLHFDASSILLEAVGKAFPCKY